MQLRKDFSLILYLSNHNTLKSDHPLELTSKAAVVRFGIEMMRRLFENENETLEEVLPLYA